MHNNYYFLRQLTGHLRTQLKGWELAACFSQVKDELILGFFKGADEFYIRAYLQPDFSCLSFPKTFFRANKNTADIFPSIIGKQISDVIQFKNERSFALKFDGGSSLAFKMYGNRANIMLFENEVNIALFKNKLVLDSKLEWKSLDRHLDQGYEAFIAHQGNWQKLFPTFGKVVKYYLNSLNYNTLPIEEQWQLLLKVKKQLEEPQQYFVTKIEKVPALSLLPLEDPLHTTKDPVEAINFFFTAYTRDYYLEKEKRVILKQLTHLHNSADAYLAKTQDKLEEIVQGKGYDKIANIIMANLHQIPPKASEIVLHDFYEDSPIKIKLNSTISPQKNAENYYRKSKNQRIEIENLEKSISNKRLRKLELEEHIREVQAIDSLKALRLYLKDHHLFQAKGPEEKVSPFKTFSVNGFHILIGKNAKNNDLLTQKYAFKEDLWLHAKDVSGSHVIIKYQTGKKFPKPVIEKAAQLAAYYSQRKTDSLCPVIVTPKKFVRKPKGAAPGAVIVDKEDVILVRPESPQNQGYNSE